MRKHQLTTALIISAIAAGAANAQSSRNCGSRDLIVERLQERYGEERAAAGLTPNNGMMEIYASDENGTWTILITMPTGQSCLVAAGKHWENMPPALTKSGAPV